MIFRMFTRVVVVLGGERRVYDRKTFSFADAQRIEEATGMAMPEWEFQLGRGSITAVAALLHVLRRRDGVPSDFKAMTFNAHDLDYVPLHDDDSEYTAQEIGEEIDRRVREAAQGPGPTPAAGEPEPLPAEDSSGQPPRLTSPSSPASTGSARGSGTGSRTGTSSSSRRTPTST